ncbi:thiamine diphosphokinase [Alkalicoccus chagannorensis]|uniref:thiamine diphosphokinase n=1 Tax=Alkalicoccus chagannorensis TaxID=427072 RepID=UPI001FE14181|nr:thiamine diphosphokinase [Alkalicoccus chagannorensis]
MITAGAPEHLSLMPDADAGDFYIGVDHGAVRLLDASLPLHVAVGDFDSVTPEEWDRVQQQAERVEHHAPEKDEVDLELAVRLAIRQGADEIHLFAGTGGRMDHALFALQMMEGCPVPVTMHDRQNRCRLLHPGTHDFTNGYDYISFLSLTGKVTGLTLSGFRYPLQDAVLSRGSSRCISNEIDARRASVSFRTGLLLVVESSDL